MRQIKNVFCDRDGTIIYDRDYLSDPAGVELLPGAARGLARMSAWGLRLFLVTNQSGIGRGMFGREDYLACHARLAELLAEEGVELADSAFCPHAPGMALGTALDSALYGEQVREQAKKRTGGPGLERAADLAAELAAEPADQLANEADRDEQGCACRKPGIGMWRELSEKHGLSAESSLMIGDKLEDVLFGRRAGFAACVLVLTGKGSAAAARLGLAPLPAGRNYRVLEGGGERPDCLARDLDAAADYLAARFPAGRAAEEAGS